MTEFTAITITKKKIEKHDNIVLLAKTKLNIMELLVSKVLVDLDISHDKLVPVNNALRKYNNMKETVKSPKIFNSDKI